jgi:serine/threonine protein kinase/WD40 repeat protein
LANALHCQQCGAALSGDSPAGLCPGCLLRTAIQTGAQDFIPALPNLRYFGDYELLEEIARGGMGVVYKARQLSLDRIVAVKMMRPGLLATEEEVKRFRAEATSAAGLKHPNIVCIYEVGERDGLHYFSMEYIPGKSLAQIVHNHPLPPGKAAHHLRTIAEAIHYAHAQGTLHRDLKPSNVLVDLSDQLHVTDFGLAKQMNAEARLTLTGEVLGTPNYMSPEQAGANDDQDYGPTSDVYALGAILYELVTGKPPFQATTPLQTLKLVLESEPVSPRVITPELSQDLEMICLKCLAKEPRRRYQSAQDLADDIGRFLRGEPILARAISPPARLWRWCRRNPWPTMAGFALVTIAVLATASAIVSRERLWSSLLQQARLQRLTGNRGDEIETLTQAFRIRNNIDLQQEAIQMAITPGVQLLFRIPFGVIKGAAFSSDSKLIAVDGQYVYGPTWREFVYPPIDVKVWDLDSQLPLAQTETVTARGYAFRPDAPDLVVVSRQQQNSRESVVFSDPVKAKDIAPLQIPDPCGRQVYGPLLFSPDGRYLMSGNSDSGGGGLFSVPDHRFVDCVPGYLLAFTSSDGLLVERGGELETLDLSSGDLPRQAQPIKVDGSLVIDPAIRLCKRSGESRPSSVAELVALSSNGRIAVVRKRALIIWDLTENKELGRVDAPHDSKVLLNPDGKFVLLYSASDPSHLQMWMQTSQGFRSQWILLAKGSRIILDEDQARFSTDGRVLAALVIQGAKGGIRLWNTETGDVIGELPDHHSPVWSKDGRLLATTSGGEIKLPDDRQGHGDSLNSSRAFTANITMGNAYEVIWKITSPSPVYHLDEAVRSLSFSPDGKQLVANGMGWNVIASDGRIDLAAFNAERLGSYATFDNTGRLWEAEFNSKGWPVEQSGVGSSIRMWEHVPEKREVLFHNSGYADMRFGPADSATMTHAGKEVQGHLTVRSAGALVSPNGQRAVVVAGVWTEYPEPAGGSSGRGEGLLELWNLATGSRLAILNQGGKRNIQGAHMIFTPDSRMLLTFGGVIQGSCNPSIAVWDTTTGALLRKIRLSDDKCTMPAQDLPAFAADGGTIFTARPAFEKRGSNLIRLNHFESGREIRRWEYEGGQILAFAVSLDGRVLASAGNDDIIRIWETSTGKELSRWEAHNSSVTALTFYPKGNVLASGGEDGSVKLWDLDHIRHELSSLRLGW